MLALNDTPEAKQCYVHSCTGSSESRQPCAIWRSMDLLHVKVLDESHGREKGTYYDVGFSSNQ
jgi:hypothetical protein